MVITDIDELFQTVYMRRRAKLSPRDIHNDIDEILLSNLKNEMEGKVMKEGFVRPGSVSLVKRSIGSMIENQFTGDIHYHLLLTAQVCNPAPGMVIRAKIFQNHKVGILATFGPLEILLAREAHMNKSIFGTAKRGELIEVHLIGKKYRLNDPKIFTSGIWANDKGGIERMEKGILETGIQRVEGVKHEHEHEHEHEEVPDAEEIIGDEVEYRRPEIEDEDEDEDEEIGELDLGDDDDEEEDFDEDEDEIDEEEN